MKHLAIRVSWTGSAVASAVLLSLSMLFPRLAFANETADCSEFQENRWWGQSVTGGQKHGASATADATILNVCTNPIGISLDGSFFFSNITPTTGGHFSDIVQYGYGACRNPACPDPTTTPVYVFAWGRDPATPGCTNFTWVPPTVSNDGTWLNSPHTFAINHVSNQYRGYLDGLHMESVGEGSICWTPARAVWFAETLDKGDQMGGLAAGNPLNITNAAYQNSEGAAFTVTNFNALNICNYTGGPAFAPYKCDVVGTRAFNVWTDR